MPLALFRQCLVLLPSYDQFPGSFSALCWMLREILEDERT